MDMLMFILAQAAASPSQKLSPLFLMLALILVFWLFMIRPQMKKQKELQKYRAALQKGDKVVTTGGIYGKVDGVSEKHIVLDVDNDVKLRIDKNAVLKDPGDLAQKK